MGISHCGTAVGECHCEVTSVPVHNRHEVVADAFNSGLGKISH